MSLSEAVQFERVKSWACDLSEQRMFHFGGRRRRRKWDQCEVILVKSLSLASEQMVPSTGAMAGWKPRVVDHMTKASRRSRSAAEVNPHHTGDAYDNLKTIEAWKIVTSVDRPWCRRVRIANNDCAQDTRRWLTCSATENFLWLLGQALMMSSILRMVRTAVTGNTRARRHLSVQACFLCLDQLFGIVWRLTLRLLTVCQSFVVVSKIICSCTRIQTPFNNCISFSIVA